MLCSYFGMTNIPSCTCKDRYYIKFLANTFLLSFNILNSGNGNPYQSSHITADVKAFDNEYPTFPDATPNKPLDLLCGADDPPIPGSADIMPLCGQDHQPLASIKLNAQEDSASATCSHAAPHTSNQVFTENLSIILPSTGFEQFFFL